ncbi:MAG: hypothetical protein BWY51_00254 [Parcubacteria group bacterium ADurb.Bin316]|nr:MAG: hypothetical protein BWY51_00254 [Parcubacteria group bacterium ADurb.Bin316]HOZ55658.1 DUF3795 domain-containing protein [bacterium]
MADKNLVAYCGLYCGACKKFINKKCAGCKENVKATWCKIRTCCIENKYSSCADCATYKVANDCKKFNNPISKLFSLIFKSDRNASIARIKETGTEQYAIEMAKKNVMSIKK